MGKSSLGNTLLGIDPRSEDAQLPVSKKVYTPSALINHVKVGDSLDSKTLDVSIHVGRFLGYGPCITVIGTRKS